MFLLLLTTPAFAQLTQGNDACPPTVISILPFADTGSTVGLADNAQGSCLGAAAPDALYSITPALTNIYTISMCGSDYDTGLIIRTGGNCPGSTEVACNDDFCGTSSQLILSLTGGQLYWIIVDGWNGGAGPYVLSVSAPNPGNDCPATPITSLPYSSTGNTCNDSNDFTNCVGSTSRDTVYAFTATASGEILVSLCNGGAQYDSGLEVRSDGNCPGDNSVGCNDDNGPGCADVASSIQFTAVTGIPYYFIIHGFSTNCGNYILAVSPPRLIGRCCYSNGQSCTDGIDEATCLNLYLGVFTPNESCATPCPCPPDTELVVRGLPAGNVLTWYTPTPGSDFVWSTTNKHHDGDPNGGADTMWTMRASNPVLPGLNSWTEPDMTPRYRAYTVTHVCP
jgi:hypothetical protein